MAPVLDSRPKDSFLENRTFRPEKSQQSGLSQAKFEDGILNRFWCNQKSQQSSLSQAKPSQAKLEDGILNRCWCNQKNKTQGLRILPCLKVIMPDTCSVLELGGLFSGSGLDMITGTVRKIPFQSQKMSFYARNCHFMLGLSL